MILELGRTPNSRGVQPRTKKEYRMLTDRSSSTTLKALVLIGAVTAWAWSACTASAALPEFKDNPVNNPITAGKQVGAGRLLTLNSEEIKCEEATVTGKTINVHELQVAIAFKQCKALGFSANSLGDPAETILTGTLHSELCYINEAAKEVALFVEIPATAPLHIEVPAPGMLLQIKGTLIGKVTPVNNLKLGPFVFEFKQALGGDPQITECKREGIKFNAGLLTSRNEGTFFSSALVATFEATFEKNLEIGA
jgi:hypothetical protein